MLRLAGKLCIKYLDAQSPLLTRQSCEWMVSVKVGAEELNTNFAGHGMAYWKLSEWAQAYKC